mgnify:CR=1 FL=1|tara:strand:+ start:86 stop:622 length:537 start_codon:yes stop_codon:yes gene_type:complete
MSGRNTRPAKALEGKRKRQMRDLPARIENAVSKAVAFGSYNPTASMKDSVIDKIRNRLDAIQGVRTGRNVGRGTIEYETSSRRKKIKIPEDPDLPIEPRVKRVPFIGDEPQNQISRGGGIGYKREIGKQLGTSEMPVGKAIRDSNKSLFAPKGQDKNSTQYFSKGGDVRYNTNRGKTY